MLTLLFGVKRAIVIALLHGVITMSYAENLAQDVSNKIDSQHVKSSLTTEKVITNSTKSKSAGEYKDCVILLHGLARTTSSFSKLEKSLLANGYHVVNQGYPSRKNTIGTLAAQTFSEALNVCADVPRSKNTTLNNLHIVTHSMGAILTRYYLQHHTIENLGRVVMLGPPNQGSELVDTLGDIKLFDMLNGPAGQQLGTEGDETIITQLPAADFDVGIIAGNKSFNLILSQFLPKPNDGKVSVQSTKLEGMSDHIVMPVTHTFMMKNKKVIAQVLHYLRYGKFVHEIAANDEDAKGMVEDGSKEAQALNPKQMEKVKKPATFEHYTSSDVL